MGNTLRPPYFSGTSGLLLPVPNKLFYPEEFKTKSRLHFYGSLMNSIEINSSFYKVPMAATVAKWAQEVPAGFRFTFKLFREITHNKGLTFDPELVKHFMQVISSAGDKKGSLLVQFPASVRINHIGQLALLMNCIRTNDPLRQWDIAVEFRHPSLYSKTIYDLLDEHEMGLVIQDKPSVVTPMLESDRSFVYVRFHGPTGNYRDSYDEAVLSEYASYIREWLDEGKTVYSYFNNTMGDALGNLSTLKQFVLEG